MHLRPRPGRPARILPPKAPPYPVLFSALSLVALGWGVTQAARLSWVCDDAFISFRYAEHLVQGLGLVYNAGERVEGYSNFLWTVGEALGMRLGFDPERWSCLWGIAAYGGTIVLLALLALRNANRCTNRLIIPAGALIAAALPDWQRFATSGLETSLYTFLLLLGYFLISRPGARRAAAAGTVFALLSMTRPDGPLAAAAALAWLSLAGGRFRRNAGLFLAAFLLLWGPYTVWRVGYYGNYFPNTYYAKSAGVAWFSQGWIYVRFFFQRYWGLLAGIALWLAAALGLRKAESAAEPEELRPEWLALGIFLLHTFYVARVGGDFMFARMLIPVTPLLLVLLDSGMARLFPARPAYSAAVTAAVLASVILGRAPIPDHTLINGIAVEWSFYTREHSELSRSHGETLRPFLEGLPVRMVFMGGEARMIYYSKVETAIEGATGLTDSAIAHQALKTRGRVGHEKTASLDYLFHRRKVNLILSSSDFRALNLDAILPSVAAWMGGQQTFLARWEPALIDSLRARGASIKEFPPRVDEYLRVLPKIPDSTALRGYRMLEPFYFNPTGDRAREKPFLERLARIPGAGAAPSAFPAPR